MAHEKPEGNTCDEADERTEEEGVVNFMEHGKEWPSDGKMFGEVEL